MKENKIQSRKLWVALFSLMIIAGSIYLLYVGPNSMLENEYEVFADTIKSVLKILGSVVVAWMLAQGGKDAIKQSQVQDIITKEHVHEKDEMEADNAR